jgi:hypothetical protein
MTAADKQRRAFCHRRRCRRSTSQRPSGPIERAAEPERVPELDIAGIVRTLNAHGVRYVVIGGVAALAHDLPVPATIDIDITPEREPGNLARLADAFDNLEAGLLTADELGTWFPASRSRIGRPTTRSTS